MSTNVTFPQKKPICILLYTPITFSVILAKNLPTYFGCWEDIYVLVETKQPRNFATMLCPTMPYTTFLIFRLIGQMGSLWLSWLL